MNKTNATNEDDEGTPKFGLDHLLRVAVVAAIAGVLVYGGYRGMSQAPEASAGDGEIEGEAEIGELSPWPIFRRAAYPAKNGELRPGEVFPLPGPPEESPMVAYEKLAAGSQQLILARTGPGDRDIGNLGDREVVYEVDPSNRVILQSDAVRADDGTVYLAVGDQSTGPGGDGMTLRLIEHIPGGGSSTIFKKSGEPQYSDPYVEVDPEGEPFFGYIERERIRGEDFEEQFHRVRAYYNGSESTVDERHIRFEGGEAVINDGFIPESDSLRIRFSEGNTPSMVWTASTTDYSDPSRPVTHYVRWGDGTEGDTATLTGGTRKRLPKPWIGAAGNGRHAIAASTDGPARGRVFFRKPGGGAPAVSVSDLDVGPIVGDERGDFFMFSAEGETTTVLRREGQKEVHRTEPHFLSTNRPPRIDSGLLGAGPGTTEAWHGRIRRGQKGDFLLADAQGVWRTVQPNAGGGDSWTTFGAGLEGMPYVSAGGDPATGNLSAGVSLFSTAGLGPDLTTGLI